MNNSISATSDLGQFTHGTQRLLLEPVLEMFQVSAMTASLAPHVQSRDSVVAAQKSHPSFGNTAGTEDKDRTKWSKY